MTISGKDGGGTLVGGRVDVADVVAAVLGVLPRVVRVAAGTML